MYKMFSLFLLLIFVSGCIPSLEESEVVVRESIHKLKVELQKDLGVDEYAMRVDDSVVIDNKIVRLESFSSDYVVVFDVDGHKTEMKETRKPLIINDLELTILPPFSYDPVNMENNYVNIKVTRFVPEEDHYLFYLGDIKTVLDHDVELIKIDKDGTVVLRVDTEDLRIMEDRTEGLANLYVSNVRPVYRAINNERHVILKIVEKP